MLRLTHADRRNRRVLDRAQSSVAPWPGIVCRSNLLLNLSLSELHDDIVILAVYPRVYRTLIACRYTSLYISRNVCSSSDKTVKRSTPRRASSLTKIQDTHFSVHPTQRPQLQPNQPTQPINLNLNPQPQSLRDEDDLCRSPCPCPCLCPLESLELRRSRCPSRPLLSTLLLLSLLRVDLGYISVIATGGFVADVICWTCACGTCA